MCVCLSICIGMRTVGVMEVRTGVGFPGTGVADYCLRVASMWLLNPGPLTEQ